MGDMVNMEDVEDTVNMDSTVRAIAQKRKKMKRVARAFKAMQINDSSDSSLEKRSPEKLEVLRETFTMIPEKRLKMVIENHPKKNTDQLIEFLSMRLQAK